jgi:hypothetical protein
VNRGEEPKRKGRNTKPNKTGNGPQDFKDDTPRAFAHLLNFQKTGKRPTHTLDDGTIHKGKKRKREAEDVTTAVTKAKDMPVAVSDTPVANLPNIRILPGERLADFAARVDQALPITGLKTKGRSSKTPGVRTEERKTKHNRRLERMQKEWREEEIRRKEKLEEEMEEEEKETEKQELLWDSVKAGWSKKTKKKNGDKLGSDQGDDEDPWAELEERKRDTKQKNLQDVVKAPPQLMGVKSNMKHYGTVGVDVRNVPGSVGSLRKREELGAARRNVIDEYRKMMGRKNQVISV